MISYHSRFYAEVFGVTILGRWTFFGSCFRVMDFFWAKMFGLIRTSPSLIPLSTPPGVLGSIYFECSLLGKATSPAIDHQDLVSAENKILSRFAQICNRMAIYQCSDLLLGLFLSKRARNVFSNDMLLSLFLGFLWPGWTGHF